MQWSLLGVVTKAPSGHERLGRIEQPDVECLVRAELAEAETPGDVRVGVEAQESSVRDARCGPVHRSVR